MYVYLIFDENWTTNMENMAKSLFFLVIVILVLQFESQYLKNRKRYRSEILHTSRVQ